MTFRQLAPPVAVMLLVLIAGTIMHGRLTDRFGMTRSETLEIYTARLPDVPQTFGAWEGMDAEVDPQQIERAQVTGHVSRTYRHRETGETVNMFLVAGTSRHITLHTPNLCYPAAGFDKEGEIQTHEVNAGLPQPVEFATSRFYKEEGAEIQHLEVMWSFSSDGKWLGPRWARTSLAGRDAIYKIYLIRQIRQTQPDGETESPATAFAREAMPVIQQTLFPTAAKQ